MCMWSDLHCEVMHVVQVCFYNYILLMISQDVAVKAVVTNKGSSIKNVRTKGGLSLIHISEPTRRTPISYAVFCLKKNWVT